MNKEQFIRQYVISYMATLAVHRVLGAFKKAKDDWESVIFAAAEIPPAELAYIAAEAAWQKLIEDGELTALEDE
jgi:hypothetical protein